MDNMETTSHAYRKARTRNLIMAGGLLSKSGLMDAFHIQPGDDLQDYEHRPKARKLLGFLITCFEDNTFDEESLEKWGKVGERRV